MTFPTGPIRGGEAEIVYKAGTVTDGIKTGLRATDSSAAGQGVRIEVEIIAAVPAPAPAPEKANAPAPAASAASAATKALAIDSALAALKKVSKFSSGGAKFQRKDIPVKVGDHIEVTVLCPEGNTQVFERVALARSYLSTAGAVSFPAEKMTVATEPPACAPS